MGSLSWGEIAVFTGFFIVFAVFAWIFFEFYKEHKMLKAADNFFSNYKGRSITFSRTIRCSSKSITDVGS